MSTVAVTKDTFDSRRLRRGRLPGLLGLLVRPVPPVRPGLRGQQREAPGRRLRQDRHRGGARARRRVQHHLDPDARRGARRRRALQPARRARPAGAGEPRRAGQGRRHGRGPRPGRPARGLTQTASASATSRTSASAPARPSTCSPTGSPSASMPAGHRARRQPGQRGRYAPAEHDRPHRHHDPVQEHLGGVVARRGAGADDRQQQHVDPGEGRVEPAPYVLPGRPGPGRGPAPRQSAGPLEVAPHVAAVERRVLRPPPGSRCARPAPPGPAPRRRPRPDRSGRPGRPVPPSARPRRGVRRRRPAPRRRRRGQRAPRWRPRPPAARTALPAATGAPPSTSSASRASSTERTRAPPWSSDGASGTTPSSGTSPWVGLCPTSPHQAAGSRIEQAVSVPSPSGTIPARDGRRRPSAGPSRGCGCGRAGCRCRRATSCWVVTPQANSWVRVRPRTTAPAARTRATIAASASAAGPAGTREPARVTWPRTSIRSFTATVTPASGPCSGPAAAARAPSASRWTKASRPGSWRRDRGERLLHQVPRVERAVADPGAAGGDGTDLTAGVSVGVPGHGGGVAAVQALADLVGRGGPPTALVAHDNDPRRGHPGQPGDPEHLPHTHADLPRGTPQRASSPTRSRRVDAGLTPAPARTGDLWLFRGRSAADRAIRAVTNAPVNHVGMAVVLDDLPPLMWHAELGQSLPDVWTGTHHRGVQLHDLEDAVTVLARPLRPAGRACASSTWR